MARPCSGTRVAWGWRALSRSARTGRTDRAGARTGSRSRTRVMSAPVPSTEARPTDHGMDAERQRELLDAMLAALRHTVGRDEHLPFVRELVESRAGPVTFAELAEAVASLDVSGRSQEWREEWAELVNALSRAAEREQS